MTMYDNHANDIEFFDIHKKKTGRGKLDIALLSDEELADIHLEVQTKLEDLIDIHSKVNNSNLGTKIARLNSFRTAIRITMKKRKVLPLTECMKQIQSLKSKLANLTENKG